jgi:hypothetical protein
LTFLSSAPAYNISSTTGEIKMGQMAVMVSESEPGEFRFSLLGSVSGPTGLLSFRPFVSDQTAHSSEMEAWIAGACAVADYLVRPVVRPQQPAQVD